jgi:antitoxin PrlF
MTEERIDTEQAWFWTPEWQQRELEADEDLATGRVTRYESDEQFLVALDERMKPLDADT